MLRFALTALLGGGLFVTPAAQGQLSDRERYEMEMLSDQFAKAYFWRRVPDHLAERCQQLGSPEMPAIQAKLAAWNVQFDDTAQLIDSLLPRFARALSAGSAEQVPPIDEEVGRVLDEQYFGANTPVGEACRQYGKILEWLGRPGMAATMRGHAYYVEGELARRERQARGVR